MLETALLSAVIALTVHRKAISDAELRRIVEQRNIASGASGSSSVTTTMGTTARIPPRTGPPAVPSC